MSLGKKLRALLAEEHITQKELAKQLNIAPSTLGSYIQDKREPDFETVRLLCDHFEVSIDYLLEYTPKNSADKPAALELEMLRIFRTLPAEQQQICVEQCRAFKTAGQITGGHPQTEEN